jgi:excisionase family DNA binding protein
MTTCILCGETSGSTALNRHRPIVVHDLVARLTVVAATPAPHDDALLTLRQAAEVLAVSYSTLTKWTARGEFCAQAFKLPNGEYRVRYRDLIRWALSLREGNV